MKRARVARHEPLFQDCEWKSGKAREIARKSGEIPEVGRKSEFTTEARRKARNATTDLHG
jgi:hypothetical protein